MIKKRKFIGVGILETEDPENPRIFLGIDKKNRQHKISREHYFRLQRAWGNDPEEVLRNHLAEYAKVRGFVTPPDSRN